MTYSFTSSPPPLCFTSSSLVPYLLNLQLHPLSPPVHLCPPPPPPLPPSLAIFTSCAHLRKLGNQNM
ncbi:hypothetical protein IHE45_05G077100 [Dioscorea alata]|uniref:Uncharacterized protein n=1 Tax=Dioscorea alata TaxID=55571 RepID=A0ACB7W2V5_DIOAL|nr:hypothetical protein IHE45_05G077100 [Dioscorea alata]